MLVEFRERQGIATVLHVILQSVLDRHPTATREDIAQCLGEMDNAVSDSLRRLSSSFGAKFEPAVVTKPFLSPTTPTTPSPTAVPDQATIIVDTPNYSAQQDAIMHDVRDNIRPELVRGPLVAGSPPGTHNAGGRSLQPVSDVPKVLVAQSGPVSIDSRLIKRSESPVPDLATLASQPSSTIESQNREDSAPAKPRAQSVQDGLAEAFLKELLQTPPPPPPGMQELLAAQGQSPAHPVNLPTSKLQTASFHNLVRETSGRTLPDVVVREIQEQLGATISSASLRRRSMFFAALTCRQWYRVARKHAWNVLRDLSNRELNALPALLKLCAETPRITIDANQITASKRRSDFSTALKGALQKMQHLSLHGVQPADLYVLDEKAPLLESLSLATTAALEVPVGLFLGHTPRLLRVALRANTLHLTDPRFLSQVRSLHLSAQIIQPGISAKQLLSWCPSLSSLQLDVAKGFSHLGKAPARTSLEYLELQEVNVHNATQHAIALLPQFGHEHINSIHIKCGAPNTFAFILRRFITELSGPSSLFIYSNGTDSGCVVSLTDAYYRRRIISDTTYHTCDKLVHPHSKHVGMLQKFFELVLWEYTPEDTLRNLARQQLGRLETLTIFVRQPTSASAAVPRTPHIFSLREQLRMPSLSVLRITSRDLSGGRLFPSSPEGLPRVSAKALASFVRILPVKLERIELDRVQLYDGDLETLMPLAREVVL